MFSNNTYPFIQSLAVDLGSPVVVIDTETTGFPNHPRTRLVEFAYMSILPSGEVRSGNKLINPKVKIPYNASKVHGIFDKDVKHSPEFPEIAPLVEKICTQAVFCGYNSHTFDYPMLRKSFEHYSLIPPDLKMHLDVRKIWTAKMKTQKGKLAEVAEYLGVGIGQEHRADGDVLTTVNVLNEMISRWGIEFVKQNILEKNKFPISVNTCNKSKASKKQKGLVNSGVRAKSQKDLICEEILKYININNQFHPDDFIYIQKKLNVQKYSISFALKDLLSENRVNIEQVCHRESQKALDDYLEEAINIYGNSKLKPLKEFVDSKCGFNIEYNQLRISLNKEIVNEMRVTYHGASPVAFERKPQGYQTTNRRD